MLCNRINCCEIVKRLVYHKISFKHKTCFWLIISKRKNIDRENLPFCAKKGLIKLYQTYASYMVRTRRLELLRQYCHMPLKHACLPFHHVRLKKGAKHLLLFYCNDIGVNILLPFNRFNFDIWIDFLDVCNHFIKLIFISVVTKEYCNNFS